MNEELALKAKAASAKAALLTSRLVAVEHAQAQHRHDERQDGGGDDFERRFKEIGSNSKLTPRQIKGRLHSVYLEILQKHKLGSPEQKRLFKQYMAEEHKANERDWNERVVPRQKAIEALMPGGKFAANQNQERKNPKLRSIKGGRKDASGPLSGPAWSGAPSRQKFSSKKAAVAFAEAEREKGNKTELHGDPAYPGKWYVSVEKAAKKDASGPSAEDLAQQIKAANLKPHQERELLSKLRAANDPFEVRAVANAFKRASRQDAIPTTLMTLAKKCAEDGDSLTEFVKKAINARMLDHARPLSENVGIAKPYYERAARGDRQDAVASWTKPHSVASLKEFEKTYNKMAQESKKPEVVHGWRKMATEAHVAWRMKSEFGRKDTTYDTRTPAGVRTLHKKVLSRTRPIEGTKATTIMERD